MKRLIFLLTSFTLALLILSCGGLEDKESEQDKSEEKKRVSIAEIEQGIKDYVAEKVEKQGGYFHLPTDTGELRFKLVRVHTEYLSNLGPDSHFACVDLADVSGDVYDVDFFMKGEPGNMSVTETTVHKLNGKPYYSWKQKEDKTWHRVPMEESSTELLGVIEGNDAFEFYYEINLPEIEKEANLWIPIASSDTYQNIEVVSIEAPENQQVLIDIAYGNKIMYMDLSEEHSNQTVKVTYKVTREEKGPYENTEEDLDRYLESLPLIPVGGRFNMIVSQALAGKEQDNDLVRARALYDYIIDNMLYQKAGIYGTGDANYACDSKTGNCTEFHSFFISLARTAGIPARFAIGAAIPSERNEGGIDGYHCWAEFFAEGKWWPVDISEGNKYTALATYYFGHHPANRIELSRGRDLEIDPGPQSGPIKFLAYPIFEMEGEEQVVKTTFSYKRDKGD